MKPVNSPSLRDACDMNYAGAFAALIPHIGSPVGGTRSFGPVLCIATGLPTAFYNPIMVTSADAAPADVAAAVGWIRALGVPASVQLRQDLEGMFGEVLADLGLERGAEADPGMALYPIPAPPPPPAELRIEPVTERTFDDWHVGISYGPGFRRAYRPSLVDDPAFRLVVGYWGGEPVAGAAAILTDHVVGIYAVGTAEHARRRGFGRAVTWAALQAGVKARCTIAVLQSSKMAFRMYQAMGFAEVCRYVDFEPSIARTG